MYSTRATKPSACSATRARSSRISATRDFSAPARRSEPGSARGSRGSCTSMIEDTRVPALCRFQAAHRLQADRTFEYSLVYFRSLERGIRQRCTGEIHTCQICLGQIDASKVRLAQNRKAQIGARKLGVSHSCAPETRAAQHQANQTHRLIARVSRTLHLLPGSTFARWCARSD